MAETVTGTDPKIVIQPHEATTAGDGTTEEPGEVARNTQTSQSLYQQMVEKYGKTVADNAIKTANEKIEGAKTE